MFWVYKSLFFFLKNNNFLNYNFFFLNYFNYYLILNNTPTLKLLDFNVIFKNVSNLKKPQNTNNFILKYFKYFNSIIFLKNARNKNQLTFYFHHNKHNFYTFNNYNYYFYKKVINLIFDVNRNNYNFMVLDRSYKSIAPLYNYIFNFQNLLIYKKYFFISSSFFTYNNWHYYYSKFANKFNIVLIIILDFFHFNKFFKTIKNINIPISSLVPIKNTINYIDYPIFTSQVFSLEKLIFLNCITQTVLMSYNINVLKKKMEFIKIFYNFSLSFKF